MDLQQLDNIESPPPGWEQGVQWDGDSGVVTTPVLGAPPNDDDWAGVLKKFGLDPARYTIDGKVRFSAWDVPGHGVQYAYRANVVQRPDSGVDVDDILDNIYLDEPPVRFAPSGSGLRTIVLTDTHIGKNLGNGGGTPLLATRWRMGVSGALEKRDYSAVNLIFGGDLIEGYVSQNGNNIIGCDLTLTEQIRTAQHLVSWTIQEALRHVDDVYVSVVPGNHGETTRVQSVPMGDSYDVMIVKNVESAFKMLELPAGKGVQFFYPQENRGSVTYTAGVTTFTVAHGHKFRNQLKGAQEWWSGHIAAGRPEAESSILVSGHFHSFLMENWHRDRWIIFGSALETESVWFSNQTGATSLPGVTSFLTKGKHPYNLEIF